MNDDPLGQEPHRALAILEIQTSIFQNLPKYERLGSLLMTQRYQNDLVSVAATCKAFTEIALDIKWRWISHIGVFLGVLSQHLFPEKRSPSKDPPNLYGRPRPKETNPVDWPKESPPNIKESGWTRLAFYTDRIRVLMNVSSSRSDVQEQDDNKAFGQLPVNRFSFPALKELHWAWQQNNEAVFAFLIQSSIGLRKIHISPAYDNGGAGWPRIMAAMLRSKGSPKAVLLEGSSESWEIHSPTTIYASLVTRKLDPEILSLPDVALGLSSVFETLAALSRIKTLGFYRGSTPSPTIPLPNAFTIPPTALMTLQSLTAPIAALRLILEYVDHPLPNLVEIKIPHNCPTPGGNYRVLSEVLYQNDLRDAFRLIQSRCTSLAKLFMVLEKVEQNGDTTDSFAAIMKPLFSSSSLTKLDIKVIAETTRSMFNPTDEDWRIVASAWPDLSNLHYSIGPSYDEENERSFSKLEGGPLGRASLQSIVHLITQLPKLRHLSIPVDCTVTPPPPTTAIPRARQCTLADMSMWRIEDQALDLIAEVLIDLRCDVIVLPTKSSKWPGERDRCERLGAIKQLVDARRKSENQKADPGWQHLVL